MPIRFTFRADTARYLLNSKQADPQAIGERLAELTEDNGGQLQPEYVVEDARDRDSPLHPHFEWQDSVAAEAYRREQARELIRIVVREDSDEKGEPARRAFINISDDDGHRYVTVVDVLNDRNMQAIVMAQALRDLEAWQHRYDELAEICRMVGAASRRLRSQLQQQQTPPRPMPPPPRGKRGRRPPPPPPPVVAKRGRGRPSGRAEGRV